jgi:hypothetical protein
MRTSIDARANLYLIEDKYRLWQENPRLGRFRVVRLFLKDSNWESSGA